MSSKLGPAMNSIREKTANKQSSSASHASASFERLLLNGSGRADGLAAERTALAS